MAARAAVAVVGAKGSSSRLTFCVGEGWADAGASARHESTDVGCACMPAATPGPPTPASAPPSRKLAHSKVEQLGGAGDVVNDGSLAGWLRAHRPLRQQRGGAVGQAQGPGAGGAAGAGSRVAGDWRSGRRHRRPADTAEPSWLAAGTPSPAADQLTGRPQRPGTLRMWWAGRGAVSVRRRRASSAGYACRAQRGLATGVASPPCPHPPCSWHCVLPTSSSLQGRRVSPREWVSEGVSKAPQRQCRWARSSPAMPEACLTGIPCPPAARLWALQGRQRAWRHCCAGRWSH